MIKFKQKYFLMLICLVTIFASKNVLATLPIDVTIGEDTYRKPTGRDLSRGLVSYYKQRRERGGERFENDTDSPHITVEHYDAERHILNFHITGASQTRHDDKYEYYSQERKLVAREPIQGVPDPRKVNVTDNSRSGHVQTDDLARNFANQLHGKLY